MCESDIVSCYTTVYIKDASQQPFERLELLSRGIYSITSMHMDGKAKKLI